MGISWTDERYADLEEAWRDGKSATECGKILAHKWCVPVITRNAILGAVFRRGLPARKTIHRTASRPRPRMPKMKPRENQAVVDELLTRLLVPERPRIVGATTVLDLEPNSCRFIAGEPGIDPYCGEEILEITDEKGVHHRYSYCAKHCAIVYGWDQPGCLSKIGRAYMAARKSKEHAYV
jgi:hypothetical protein